MLNWIVRPENLTAVATLVIAIFTIVLAVVGFVQAELTRRTIALARSEFLATHRPRIRVRWVSGPTGDDRTVIKVYITNVGESLATIVEYYLDAAFLDSDGCFCYPYATIPIADPAEAGKKIILAPGESRTLELFRTGENPEHMWARCTEKGDTFFVVEGTITYIDESGIGRSTGFAREMIQESGGYRVFRGPAQAGSEYED